MKLRLILLVLLVSSSLAFWLDDPVNIENVKDPEVVTDKFKKNALDQSYAGRALYTWPDEDTDKEFKSVCEHAWKLVSKLGDLFNNPTCDNVYRSRSATGAGRANDKAVNSTDIITQIKRVAEGKDPSPNDRMVCITTFGDIAQALVDSYWKPFWDQNDCMKNSQSIITDYLGKKPAELFQAVKTFSLNRSANAMTKGKKTYERANNEGETPLRSGVYDQGALADANLKKKGASKFINSIGWPKQKIEEKRLKKLARTNEVWAGHITGSGPEVLFLWDLVSETKFPLWIAYTKCDPKKKDQVCCKALETIKINVTDDAKNEQTAEICPELRTEQRNARTAIVLGFLLGAGFHTAFESHLVINQYLGFNYWPAYKDLCEINDTGDTVYMKDATKTMTDVLKAHTNEPNEPNVPKPIYILNKSNWINGAPNMPDSKKRRRRIRRKNLK